MPGARTTPSPSSSEQRIAELISKFEPKDQQLIKALRKILCKRYPTLNELVYDYARNFVIGYSPTEAGGQGLVAISADAEGVRLYLNNGSTLRDPHKLLEGKAGARHLALASARDLDRPEVEALMSANEKAAKVPIPAAGRGELIMKDSASGRKRTKKPAKR